MEPAEEKDGFPGVSIWNIIFPWDTTQRYKVDKKYQIEGMTRNKIYESSQ